jgi:hypothetical protein
MRGFLGDTPLAFALGKRSKRKMWGWVSVTGNDSARRVTCQYYCDVVTFERIVEKRGKS